MTVNPATVSPPREERLLEVTGLKKHFGGVNALQGVNFSLHKGEAHALVGENGAGKSTLIKVLTGVHSFDGGEILLNGQPYLPKSPKVAKQLGIQVVHQEFNLLAHLTVAENICFEAFPRTPIGLLDRKEMNRRARKAMDAVGLTSVSETERIDRLGIAQRQLVEIARALESKSEILILDEPTATLSDREIDILFKVIEQIKAQGVTIVFVSHHIEEVMALCDRVTVFRSGRTITTESIDQTSPEKIVSHMVGKALHDQMATPDPEQKPKPLGPIALQVKQLKVPDAPYSEGISFELREGEILGIAGLVGSGRTEILQSLAGAKPALAGEILRKNKPVKIHHPKDAIANGMGYVTEDRKDEGLILTMPIVDNISLASMARVSSLGLINRAKERKLAQQFSSSLKIKLGSLADSASSLSGGNQQKVVLAKWLAMGPDILLLDEPTRGVDVGAKAEIYSLLKSLSDEGMTQLIVSSELPELITLCDRILVMSNHKIVGELSRAQFCQETILQMAYNNLKLGEVNE